MTLKLGLLGGAAAVVAPMDVVIEHQFFHDGHQIGGPMSCIECRGDAIQAVERFSQHERKFRSNLKDHEAVVGKLRKAFLRLIVRRLVQFRGVGHP